ncbi:12989_t:CDS:2, partial [Cetraspora pellucida]
MSFESVGQNKSISENVTKETSTSPLQDIITPMKKSQDILEYNTVESFENEQTNNLNDLGGDVSNLNHLNNGGPFNLSESSGVLSSSSNTAGQNGHLRRWHSSNSGLHHSKSTTFGNSENDEIRAIYEHGKSPAPPLSPHELRLEKKESLRSLKWALWVSSNKFVKRSGKFGCSSYVFPWDKK